MDFGEELARMKAEMGGRSIGFAMGTVGEYSGRDFDIKDCDGVR